MERPEGAFPRQPTESCGTCTPEPTNGQRLEKLGVLVVDDEDVVRDTVQMSLERYGLEVRSTPNGREAIDFYRRKAEDIALVLLDGSLPGLDRLETLVALRELNPRVLVCFMSNESVADESRSFLERCCAYVVAKPNVMEELANVVERMMRRARNERFALGKEREGPVL